MCILVIVTRQRLCKHIPAATNISNIRKIVGGAVSCVVPAVSMESLWVCICVQNCNILVCAAEAMVRSFLKQSASKIWS
jgi:hypothetical protein